MNVKSNRNIFNIHNKIDIYFLICLIEDLYSKYDK